MSGVSDSESSDYSEHIQDALSAIDRYANDNDGGTLEKPEYQKTTFNTVIAKFDEVNDAEDKALEYYSNLGFNVIPMLKQYQPEIDEFPWFNQKDSMQTTEPNIDCTEPGVPDFFVFRIFNEVRRDPFKGFETSNIMNSWRFVEVKSENDSLKPNQIKWIADRPNIPVDVIIIKESV